MKTLLCLLSVIVAAATASAQPSSHFCDSTLRLDYILSGVKSDVDISLKAKHRSTGWHGRTVNLDKLQYTGNIDVTVTDLAGDTIFRNSLSSLFSEWLDIGDTVPCAQECTVLIPYPKDSAYVNVSVLDKYHKPAATIRHLVDPADILIKQNNRPALPHKYIWQGSYPGHHIQVAYLGEGYTQDEMETFYKDAEQATKALFSHEPFAEMKERFDFVAVEVPSAQSGVSVPKNNDWKDTAFKSHYSTFYSDRYLTSSNVFDMHEALNGIPYEHIIVLVNSDTYGGGGIFNDYTLTAAHIPTFNEVLVHEFGHSFGGLADEYFYEGDVMDDTYPTDAEPWEPNITTLVDFGSKWQDMLAEGTPIPTDPAQAELYPVGVYEGGGYSTKGIYRPADYCRMRVNDIDAFCPVCQRAIRDLIIYYTEEQ